jgi:hypothetical protein
MKHWRNLENSLCLALNTTKHRELLVNRERGRVRLSELLRVREQRVVTCIMLIDYFRRV